LVTWFKPSHCKGKSNRWEAGRIHSQGNSANIMPAAATAGLTWSQRKPAAWVFCKKRWR
jgi:hypothetical protein